MAISQHFSREERKYSFRKNDMRVKKPGEPIQKCNQINIFIVHTEKTACICYILPLHDLHICAFKDKTAFYLYYKRVMRIEVAHKQPEPLSGALYREQIQILSNAYELHLSK